MDSLWFLLFLCSTFSALTLLGDHCMASPALDYDNDDDNDNGADPSSPSSYFEVYDMSPVPVGKRSQHPYCRRCMMRRNDWMSCNFCYGRPGIVPYYGKRSSSSPVNFPDSDFNDDDDAVQLPDILSDPGMLKEEEKRFSSSKASSSFIDNRCCRILGLRQCCRRSYQKRGYDTIFFPDDFADGQLQRPWKREYETSFYPLDSAGIGQCSCCDGELFDFSCCSLACSKRK